MGEKIWRITQAVLDEICTTSIGPYSYSCLDDLCCKFQIQCIVFSGLLAQPIYFFPLNEMEPRADLPCIFLQEVVSLDPNSKAQFHMNVIIKPEMVYPKKYACRNCFQLVSIQSQHKYCSKLKTCWFCGRKKLKPGHWFDALMVGRYCPSALENHPAVEYRHEPCPVVMKILPQFAVSKNIRPTA